MSKPTFTGYLVEARIVCLFRMNDREKTDYKILCVPVRDPLLAGCQERDTDL